MCSKTVSYHRWTNCRVTHKPRQMCSEAAKGRALSPPWWVRWSSLLWGWRVLRGDWFLRFSSRLLYLQLGSIRWLGGMDSALNAQSPPHPPVWRDKGKRFKKILIVQSTRLQKWSILQNCSKCLSFKCILWIFNWIGYFFII